MFNIIASLLATFTFVIFREMWNADHEKELIEKCISDLKFIRKRVKENYVVYQYMTSGKSVDTMKLTKLLQDYTGKNVRVFFDRVLTVRIYKTSLPKEVRLPSNVGNSLNIQIGIGVDGAVWHDFSQYPHMIVAGTTGYGKTNFLKGIMNQLDGDIVLLDLKGSSDYEQVSASNISEAANELREISSVLRRGRRRRLFVVVDEAAELLAPSYMTRKEAGDYLYCQSVISEIARLGRSLGVSLIYATQYPTADVLPRQVKQNCESRVVFRLPTEVASRVALDEGGAELLETGLWGRAIYKTDHCQTIQTYLSDEREDFNVKVRDTQAQGTRDHIQIG